MLQNKEKYIMVKERQSEDVTIITFTKKERKCDICLCIKKGRDIVIVKYPIIHRTMGRLMMDKKVCTDCYVEVKEILNNLKYN